jgi:hypothetical protein
MPCCGKVSWGWGFHECVNQMRQPEDRRMYLICIHDRVVAVGDYYDFPGGRYLPGRHMDVAFKRPLLIGFGNANKGAIDDTCGMNLPRP